MAYFNPCHRGLAYGDGYMQGEGRRAHVAKIVGNDLFAINDNPETRSFGIFINDYAAGDMPGIFCNGGVYETDVFEGAINPGDALKVSASGQLTGGNIGNNEHVVAQAISVQNGILKFILLI